MRSTTFSELDDAAGKQIQGGDSALGRWYDSVKDKPIPDLTIDDLSRALRQEVHLEDVIPAATRYLASDPLAGHQYDGELISALARVPSQFWKMHPALADQASALMMQSRDALDDDIRSEIDAFLRSHR
jgi:hypothetical protein